LHLTRRHCGFSEFNVSPAAAQVNGSVRRRRAFGVANAAIYLPYADIDLADVLAGAVATRDAAGLVDRFDVTLGGQLARFNVMPPAEVNRHLTGFTRWVGTLDEPDDRKADARLLISGAKTVLGLVAAGEFQDNPALWQALFRIVDKWDGFVFVYNSIMLPNGGVVVGPLRQDAEPKAAADGGGM
jgi:hypothetical protein